MTPSNPYGGARQEWIDKKDGLPGEMVNDPTAQQRTDSGGNCGKPSPGPDGYTPLCLGERGTDDRKRAGDQKRGTDTLYRPGNNQLGHVGRKGAPYGGDGVRDNGQSYVDHRLVDVGDDRCQNGCNQYPSSLARGAISRATSRPDDLFIARSCPGIDQNPLAPGTKLAPEPGRTTQSRWTHESNAGPS